MTPTLSLFNLKATDFVGAKACAIKAPDLPFVELAHSLVFVSPTLQSGQIELNLRQPVNTQGIFIVTGIQMLVPAAAGASTPIAYVRFQWPNGRYNSNIRVDHTKLFAPFQPVDPSSVSNTGYVAPRPIRIEPIECLPGSEVVIELENRASLNQGPLAVMIEFRGRLRRYLKPNAK